MAVLTAARERAPWRCKYESRKKNTPFDPFFARLPNQRHAFKCAQTLQTLRPCPKPRAYKVWAPWLYSSPYWLAAKTRSRISSWSKLSVNRPIPSVTEEITPPPHHAGWLYIRLGERAATLAGPQDLQIDPSFRASPAPPALKPAVAEVVQRAPNQARWLSTRCDKQVAT